MVEVEVAEIMCGCHVYSVLRRSPAKAACQGVVKVELDAKLPV
jgi:hypothetical protein